MARKITLIVKPGEKYGKLTVLEEPIKMDGTYVCKCRCECGSIKYYTKRNLKSGNSKSCGCQGKERIRKLAYKHGLSKTIIHKKWRGMKDRCYNPNNIEYKCYGGRGIIVCPEWKNDFTAFYNWAMKNGYDSSLSIDRIDVNGNYEPSNCRWATRDVQHNNTRLNFKITYQGKTLTVTQWSKIVGIHRGTITDRIKKCGWSVEDALTKKPRKTYDHKQHRRCKKAI